MGHSREVLGWLLDGDPAIRWQVLRDLAGAPEDQWLAEQQRVASDGWGARLLSHQDADGRWTPRLYGKKWISTTYSLLLLCLLGLPGTDERARRSCRLFLDEGLWTDGGMNLSATTRRSETCVTGMVLSLLSWFGIDDPRRERLVDYLAAEQMPDGGWNCRRHAGATHSSFHTTINVLEGLREYAAADERRTAAVDAVPAMAARGREFLAVHSLYRSHRTGRPVDPKLTRLSFPPQWHHDILRGLDHFRGAAAPADPRLRDPVDVLRRLRLDDGRWPLQQRHPGASWFEMERVGEPSRWNTLRALRVIDWFESRG